MMINLKRAALYMNLIAELKLAKHPSVHIDANIGSLFFEEHRIQYDKDRGWFLNRKTKDDQHWIPYEPPPYTSNTDMARTLFPEDAWLEVSGPRRSINIPTPVPNFWRVQLCVWEKESKDLTAWGYTLPLAICQVGLMYMREKEST